MGFFELSGGASALGGALRVPAVQTFKTTNPKDVTLSSSGATAYVSDSEGWVTAFDVATGEQVGRWKVGDSLSGMDVSPDGRYLIAGELQVTDTSGDQWNYKGLATVHRLDLRTGEVKNFTTEISGLDRGFYDVAWGNNGRVVLTQTFAGSGFTSLWTLDPQSGEFSKSVSTYSQNGVLTASEDGAKILFGPQNSSGGAMYVHDVAAGTTTYALSNDGYNNGIQAISAKAGMLVQALYGQVLVYDLSY